MLRGCAVVFLKSTSKIADVRESGMLSVPVWYDEGVRDSLVEGCIFYNTGDSAVCIGNGELSAEDLSEQRRVVNVDVTNNLMRNIGTQNRSAAI